MKKHFCMFSAIMLAAALVLTGCGSDSAKDDDEASDSPKKEAKAKEPDSPLAVAKAYVAAVYDFDNFDLDKVTSYLTGEMKEEIESEFESFNTASEEEKKEKLMQGKESMQRKPITWTWGEETIDGDTATVKAMRERKFSDGHIKQTETTWEFVKIDGQWKIKKLGKI
ncbi:MAG: DUF4878 domain-containing protein [Victivallales bacterium]|nr:DUF4878 domain-containing protein [Victivallales bacterium]